jgi:ribonuclease HI
MIEVWVDGLCEPVMPAHLRTGCIGFLLRKNGRTIFSGSEVIGRGEGLTGNVAEYMAVIRALEKAKSLGLMSEKIIVFSDSQWLVKQMNGQNSVKAEGVKPLNTRVRELISGRDIVFQWVPRGRNWEAHDLSRTAYISFRRGKFKNLKIRNWRKPEKGKYFQF